MKNMMKDLRKVVKKSIIIFIAFLSIFSLNIDLGNAECKMKDGEEFSLVENLKGCKPKTLAGENDVEYTIEGGFKDKLGSVITLVMSLLGVASVGAIAFGGFMMVISLGDDTKFDKAKEIIQWGIFGFLAMISAGGIIAIIVNIIYFLID